MRKVCCILLSSLFLMGVDLKMEQDRYFIDQLSFVEKVVVYDDGNVQVYEKNNSEYAVIIEAFSAMLEGYREMPAFGVSLHEEVENAKKSGLWIEFCYESIYMHEEMPYERLLIGLEKGDRGFNLMRFCGGKYEGRCFYVDLNFETTKFIETLEFVRKLASL